MLRAMGRLEKVVMEEAANSDTGREVAPYDVESLVVGFLQR